NTTEAKERQFTSKLPHRTASNHHYQTISEDFAESVNDRTDGNASLETYPPHQLRSHNLAVEGTMIGTQDMAITSNTVLSKWIPEVEVINMPYLFEDSDHVRNTLDGQIGEELSSHVEEEGAMVLAWWENGFRSITNSRNVIKEPSDLEGLSIRTPEGEIFLDTFEAFGALPTPISFSELYSA